MQIMLSIVKLAVFSFLLFWLVRYWILINREYKDELVRNYKHGQPYGFAVWKNFKAIVIDGTKTAWRGEDLPRSIPLATVPYPRWVIERAEKEGPCTCYLCQAMEMLFVATKKKDC